MPISSNFEISNNIEELENVSFFLDEFCDSYEVPMKILNSFQIALDELLSNTINYGFKKNDDGKIEIIVTLDGNILTVVLTDNAKEFDPHDAPKPDIENNDVENKKIGGLGIHIVGKMMDIFKYERKKNLNVITLSKKF